jgi:hypothetical protein
VLAGSVTTSDGRSAAGALLSIVNGAAKAIAVADGGFELRDIPAGSQVIEVRFLGYSTLQVDIDFDSGARLLQNLQLQVEPIALAPLEVQTRRAIPAALQGFYDRRERAVGYFFTRSEIQTMEARLFTDVLRRVPGVRMQQVTGPFGSSEAVQIGRNSGIAGARGCPVLFYVDGMPFRLSPDVGINNFIRPDDVAGVEVYSGTARVPPPFNSAPNNARCGVVAIWTYAGGGGG